MPPSTSTVSRKRTRSSHVSESNNDSQPTTSTSTSAAPPKRPKRQRNNPSTSRTNYSLRNRSVTSDTQRYNLRPRTSQSQVRVPETSTSHPITIVPHRTRHPISPTISNITPQEQTILPATQPRQYRLVYISDDDDHQPTTATTSTTPTVVNTTFNLVTDDEDDEPRRPQVTSRRTPRSTTTTR